MQVRSEVKAGVVIVSSLFLFVVIFIAAGRFGEMLSPKQSLHVLFSDVQGLKVDDPVQVMGFEHGRVTGIEISQLKDSSGLVSPIIEVTAKVVYPEALPKDTKITVDRTLTGNTVLKVDPGRSKERYASDEKIIGLGAVSFTELAGKAGVMAKRLDDFLSDLTDKNISEAIRSLVINLKEISSEAKTVTSSLSQGIPGSQKSLTSSLKHLEEISQAVDQIISGNKEKIAETIKNVNHLSESMAKVSNNVDLIIDKNSGVIQGSLVNMEKATSNIKAVTREVRWQPWVLLNKPDEVEIRERSVYNSALEFSEGAETLNNSVKELVSLMNKRGPASEDSKGYGKILERIHQSLEKSSELERKLWTTLNERSKKN